MSTRRRRILRAGRWRWRTLWGDLHATTNGYLCPGDRLCLGAACGLFEPDRDIGRQRRLLPTENQLLQRQLVFGANRALRSYCRTGERYHSRNWTSHSCFTGGRESQWRSVRFGELWRALLWLWGKHLYL